MLRFMYIQPNLSVSLSQTWYLLIKNVFCPSAVGSSWEEDMVLTLQSLQTSLITPFTARLCLASASLIPKSNSEPNRAGQHSCTHLPTSWHLHPPRVPRESAPQESRNAQDTYQTQVPSLCSFLSAWLCPWPFFNFLRFLADSLRPSLGTLAHLHRSCHCDPWRVWARTWPLPLEQMFSRPHQL